MVAQRTSEIGIRMALGARPSRVLLLVEKQGLLLVLAGVAIGAVGGLLLTRLMASLLFHVRPNELWWLARPHSYWYRLLRAICRRVGRREWIR